MHDRGGTLPPLPATVSALSRPDIIPPAGRAWLLWDHFRTVAQRHDGAPARPTSDRRRRLGADVVLGQDSGPFGCGHWASLAAAGAMGETRMGPGQPGTGRNAK